MKLKKLLLSNKKELFFKIITSVFLRGLLLIIPIYWSNAINNLTEGNFKITYYLVIITLVLSLFYYLWQCLNQYSWYEFYDKLYLDITNKINFVNKDKLSLGEYTNIVNNDVDVICTFSGNFITRIIQILEFLVIYIYFLSINLYIFLITIIVSLLSLTIILISGKKVNKKNERRKDTLDKKTIAIQEVYDNMSDKLYDKSYLYLKANTNFNLYAMNVIYVILALIEFVSYLLIIYSVYLVSKGMLEIGSILLIYSYYTKIITNFEVLGTISAEYQSMKVSLKRLNKLSLNNN